MNHILLDGRFLILHELHHHIRTSCNKNTFHQEGEALSLWRPSCLFHYVNTFDKSLSVRGCNMVMYSMAVVSVSQPLMALH